MARIGTLQANFAGGEISPRLYGRVDFAKYLSGAEVIENFIVRPEGGLMRRHGTRFAGETRVHTKQSRLIPFIFSTVQAYMLEFGHGYVRFWKDYAPIISSTKSITAITLGAPAVVTAVAHGFTNGDRVIIAGVAGMGQVNNREFVVANQTANTFELSGVDASGYDAYTMGGTVSKIYEIASPYPEADIGGIFFSQSADTLYLAHPNHAPRTLTRTGHTSWTMAQMPLDRGPFATMNGDPTARVMCTGSGYQPGDDVAVKASAPIFSAGHVGSYFYMQEMYFDQLAVSPWASTTAMNTAIGTQVSSSGNVYALVDAGNGQGTGSVIPSHTEGDAWDNPTGSGLTNYKKWRYLHSRWAIVLLDDFQDSKNMSGKVVTYLCNGLAPQQREIASVTNAGGVCRVTTESSPPNGYNEGDYVHITGVVGASQANGSWKIVNVNPATHTFDLENSTTPGTHSAGTGSVKRFSTSLWAHSAFSAARGYPSCVALHEQRLVFANTAQQPFGFWASTSGDYGNFLPGTKDDETISYAIAANQADPIRWITSGSDLTIGTLSQEFAAYGGGLGDPITPSNTRIVPQSGEGSNGVQPAKVGVETLFVNRAGRKIFSLLNQSDVGAYVAMDLMEIAEHLTLNATIVRVAWAKNPSSILWALRSDGVLLAMTYRREQQVFAWSRQIIEGYVESIAVIPSANGTTDDLWLTVRRTINGTTRRYVEYLAPPFEPTGPQDKGAMSYLDSALRYTGAPVTAVSGLSHLEGQSVKIVADGAVHPDRLVSGGKVTLEIGATNVWVGMPYTSRLRTVRPEVQAMGTAQGKTKRIPRIGVRVHNSIGGLIGPGDETVMEELVRRDQADAMDASPPMRSGDFDVHLASDFDVDGRIAVLQTEPMPLDILSIMPVMSVADG